MSRETLKVAWEINKRNFAWTQMCSQPPNISTFILSDDSRWKPCIRLPLQANGDLSAGSIFLSLWVLYLDVFALFTHKIKIQASASGRCGDGGCNYIQHVISDKNEAAIMQNNNPLSLYVPLLWHAQTTKRHLEMLLFILFDVWEHAGKVIKTWLKFFSSASILYPFNVHFLHPSASLSIFIFKLSLKMKKRTQMEPFSGRHITESGLERLRLIILPQFNSWLGLLCDSEPWPPTDFFPLQLFCWMFPRKHTLIALKCELVSNLMAAATFTCIQRHTLERFSLFRSHHLNPLSPITQPLYPQCFRVDWLFLLALFFLLLPFQPRNESFLGIKSDYSIFMIAGCFLPQHSRSF